MVRGAEALLQRGRQLQAEAQRRGAVICRLISRE
jgi:hypothetical protein